MTLNVGLVGYGYSGSVFHAPLIHSVRDMSLRAIVSSDAAKVSRDYPQAIVLPDVETLLADAGIEVVVITSPNKTHYEYAKKAILAGKHVVVEKPFTISSAEADELVVLAKSKGVLLTVFHNRRWDSDFLTIQRLLQENALGTITTYEAHFDRFRPTVRDRWREKDIPGSGLLYDLGSHLIDQALILFGLPRTVWGDLRRERSNAEAVDYFHIILGYENRRIILHAASLAREAGPKFIIHGDRGSFIKYGLDSQEDQLKAGLKPGCPGWGEDRPEQYGKLTVDIGGVAVKGTVETVPGRYQSFYEELALAIRQKTDFPVHAEEARDTIRIIEYVQQSYQEQRTIVTL